MSAKFNTRRYFQILGITLAILLTGVLACIGYTYMSSSLNKPQGEGLTDVEENGKINVLLMGVDQEGLRTDAIMVASYDTTTNEVKMLSIPRDTRMYIGARYQKINAAHALSDGNGGIKGALSTVEAVNRLTGIPINYYVSFSFQAIEECIDLIGPITFEIPDLYNDGVGMVYDDPVQDLHINLKPGVQELDGEKVVQLLRYRKGNMDPETKVRHGYADGDRGRMEVQQQFLQALVDQKLNAGLILKIPALFKQVEENIETNFTVKDVVKYSKYLNDLKSTNIHTFTLPGKDSGDEYDASYWICDLEATRELIETEFGYDASGITIDKRGEDGQSASAASTAKSTSSAKASATKEAVKTSSASSSKTSAPKETAKATAKATKKPQSEATQKPKRTEEPEETKKPQSTAKATKAPAKEDSGTDSSQKDTGSSQNEEVKKTSTPVKTTVDDQEDAESA